MTLNYATPVINPRLGSGFAIFASTYTCLVLLLIVLEQLGLSAPAIDELISDRARPVLHRHRLHDADDRHRAISCSPGSACRRSTTRWPSRRRYSAAAILLGSIGSFFFAGIDAIAILLGCFAGLILTGVLFVPHLRKAGANTLPGFLHLRFGRNRVRLVACLARDRAGPMVLAAEVALGGKVLGYVLPLPQTLGIRLGAGLFLYSHRLHLPVPDRRSGRHALGDLDASGAIHRRSRHSRHR